MPEEVIAVAGLDLSDKVQVARRLEDVATQRRQLEKEEKFLKAKLDPLMVVGERIGLVEKYAKETLDVDRELLDILKQQFGPEIIREELNTPFLRARMDADPELEARIPRARKEEIKVK